MTRLATTRLRAAGVLTAITMTALLAACSANDSAGDTSGASSGESSDGGADAGSADAGGRGVGTAREFGSTDAETSSSGSSADSSSGTGSTLSPQGPRSIIATGTVSLASKDVGEARREVQRIVDAQGGNVTDESTETDEKGRTSYARLVVRVPSSKFSAAMEALEEVAVLRSSDRGSDDVTTQVIDNGARVRAQEASLKRVELLLAQAKTLKDIIWIESQLTSRQADLDSLKSQQAWLRDQTAMSTITVDISMPSSGVIEEPADDDTPAGFMAGLRGGMKAVGAMLVAFATIFGALLPFSVIVLVLGLPVWLVVRRRKAPPSQTPAA